MKNIYLQQGKYHYQQCIISLKVQEWNLNVVTNKEMVKNDKNGYANYPELNITQCIYELKHLSWVRWSTSIIPEAWETEEGGSQV